MLQLLSRLYKPAQTIPVITLMGEDLAVAIKALQRSSQAMPDETETFKSRAVRQARETRLATQLRAAIARSL